MAAVRSALEIGDLTVAAIATQFYTGNTVPGQIASVLYALIELGIVTENNGLFALRH